MSSWLEYRPIIEFYPQSNANKLKDEHLYEVKDGKCRFRKCADSDIRKHRLKRKAKHISHKNIEFNCCYIIG
jgi:hypothetical protein